MSTYCQLPKSLDKLVEKGTAYYRLCERIDDDSLFSMFGSEESRINETVKSNAGRLVECVLLGERSWALIIHFDVFVQNNADIDDCALPKKSAYVERASGYVIDKNEYGAMWKEIVVRWGNMEFLALGGFCGERGSSARRPFLGSALPASVAAMLRCAKYEVLVPYEPVKAVSSVRFLRNYTKKVAGKPWSFGSKRFSREGFQPCHPLAVDRHTLRMNARSKDKASLASLVLDIVIARKYTQED